MDGMACLRLCLWFGGWIASESQDVRCLCAPWATADLLLGHFRTCLGSEGFERRCAFDVVASLLLLVEVQDGECSPFPV